MTELVIRNYRWLEVTRNVGKYVEGCNMCQGIKNRMEVLAGKLKLSKVPEKLWIYLMVDFIMKLLLWQPLIIRTNDHTSGKSLKLDIKWEVHKRTQQGVSAKLESYIYKIHMVCATSSCSSYFLLKATMLYTCVLISSSRSFYYVLGL